MSKDAVARLLALLSFLLVVPSAAPSPHSTLPNSHSRPADVVAADDARTTRRHRRATGTTSSSSSSSRPHRSTQEKEERYEIVSSSGILERLQRLVADYPNFATLTTTQEWFGLPRAGGDADCPFDENYEVNGEVVSGKGCNNYVLIIQDKEAYPEDPDVGLAGGAERYLDLEGSEEGGERSGWRYVPDVFLSGAVHGDERVGPTALLEMSELLVEAARCESLPRMRYKPGESANATGAADGASPGAPPDSDDEGEARWEEELASARACRRSIAAERGVPPRDRRWLARLVSTRRTVVIVAANALGYSRDERAEDGIDPNRDFPFDVEPARADECMRTVAGRSINELFRSHLFPVGLTFHGGMEVVAYEWGAPTYLGKDAPDEAAQRQVAGAYSRYAGGFPGHAPYDFGTMNDMVYYVRGGMEDWAFAGSWDPERVVECVPTTHGGYPKERTRYGNSTLRAFNMLVETSKHKTPDRNDLGKRNRPLETGSGEDNGHIARNIRLALLAIDVVEPYVSIRNVGGLELEDDVVPAVNLRRYDGKSYFENSMIVWVPRVSSGNDGDGDGGDWRKMENSLGTKISWTVGGAFNIDETELLVGPWDALPFNLGDVNDGTYPSAETMDSINSNFFVVTPTTAEGRSRWHAEGPHPKSPDDPTNPAFEAYVDASAYAPGTNLAVFARARVDASWLEPSANVDPAGLGPLSHLVNARRNPSYRASNAGKVVRGRVDDWWYSAPVALAVGSAGPGGGASAPPANGGGGAGPVHVNARLDYLADVTKAAVSRQEYSDRGAAVAPTARSLPWLLGSLAVAILLVSALAALARGARRRGRARGPERPAEEEEDSFSLNSYQDAPADDGDGGAGAGDARPDVELPQL